MTDATQPFPEGSPWLEVVQLPEAIILGPKTGSLVRTVGLPSPESWRQVMAAGIGSDVGIPCSHALAALSLPHFAEILQRCSPTSSAELHSIASDGIEAVIESMKGIQADIRSAFELNLHDFVGKPGVTSIVSIDRSAIGAFIVKREVRLCNDTIEYRVNPLLHGGRGVFNNVALMVGLQHQVVADMECLVNAGWKAGVSASLAPIAVAAPGKKKSPMFGLLSAVLDDSHRYLFGLQGERMPASTPRATVEILPTRVIEQADEPPTNTMVQ